MNTTLMPKKKMGKMAITSVIISIVLIIGIIVIAVNLKTETIDDGFFGNIPLALMALGAFAASVISFLAGVAAVIKQKERSILLFICLIVSVFFIYFGIAQIIGEITGSH